jgi:hypothetical protein
VNRKLWLQTAAILTLAISAVSTNAQSSGLPVMLAGVHSPGSPAAPASSSSAQAIVFDAIPLGGAPQQLTATFNLGSTASIPTASLHYGRDYSLGQLSCSGQTCSVTVSFSPMLPGARPDALFLTNGTQRVATIPLSGTGQSPFALLQPASLASSSTSGIAAAVLDENGTLYSLDATRAAVTATDSTGKSTTLPIANLTSAHGIAIDGAGVLYVLTAGTDRAILTYDTVQSIQGSLALPVPVNAIESIAVGAAGDFYAVSASADLLYKVSPGGAVSSTPLHAAGGPATSALVLAGDLVLGGNSIQSGTMLGAKSRIATQTAETSFSLLGADAAGTLYANSSGSLLELAAPDFTSTIGTLPAALAIGSDGSLLVSGAQGVTRLDRTQTQLDFGSVAPSVNAEPQVAQLYNAGNQSLTISDIRVAGDGFSIGSAPGANCAGGLVVAPGSSCQIAVALLAPQSGIATGTVSIASNSLNQPSSLLKLPVVAHTAGSQAILTPNALIFPNTTVNVASAAQTITLSNPGTSALNLSSIALTGAASGSYSLTTTCLSSTVTSLAAGASCTISVIFKPLTAASQAAVVSVGDDVNGVAGSSQTATLIGLGTAAPAPVISFSAVSVNGLSSSGLTFGSATNPVLVVPSGTPTPPTGTVTVTNTGNAVLNISTLTLILSGTSTILPYTQTNNCPATLAVGASCVVTVQFTPPLGVGATYTASLVFVDNAAGSPQTFGISGIATTNDFTLSTSTANVIIPSTGGSAQVVITGTPDPGPFSTPIGLSVFGMPGAATYTFSPSTITAVTTPGTSTFTITLPTYQNIVLSSLDKPSILRRTSLPAAAFLLAGMCFLRRRRMPRLTRALQILIVGVLGFGATSLSGCGSSGVPVSGGVAPGTYYLAVSGTSANGTPTTVGATHQVVITLLVK